MVLRDNKQNMQNSKILILKEHKTEVEQINNSIDEVVK